MKKSKILKQFFKEPEIALEIIDEFMLINNFNNLPLGQSINMLFGLRLVKKDEKTLEIYGSILCDQESFEYFKQQTEPVFKKYGISIKYTNYVMVFQPLKK